MERLRVLSEPVNAKQILKNLSLAIDEARTVRRIVELSDNLHRIEYQPELSSRVKFLRNEIAALELQLVKTRELDKVR
ncbi:MAG: hypothetical protein GY820_44930 [Gammaproteobacteria bacterium]|nr:hypothetical protein [Gammaproteobacteria bacterium]